MKKFEVQEVSLDQHGRVVMSDEVLDMMISGNEAIAAGANLSSCNGTTNISCTNYLSCGNTWNGWCSNPESCVGTANGSCPTREGDVNS